MSKLKLKEWMIPTNPVEDVEQVVVLKERGDSRAAVQAAIKETVKDHFAGLDILARIGKYKTALEFIRNKLPPGKRTRSGDFGEIMASEYIDQLTEYRVPIKKLRWKDDRKVPMRGNDVLAIQKREKRWRLLKAESKSRAALSSAAIAEAIDGLNEHSGRPNPSSLAFICKRPPGPSGDRLDFSPALSAGGPAAVGAAPLLAVGPIAPFLDAVLADEVGV